MKGDGTIEWLNRMSDALIYIEKNIEGEVNVEAIAKITYSSPFHFQRMFHMLTGVTVVEYVRKRRLSLAAQELMTGQHKVLDVALKYGYETPESFSKAFKKLHGVNPSEVKHTGVSLKAFPPISFQISLKGDKEMDYRIEKSEGFKVVGKSIKVSMQGGQNNIVIPQFWDENCENGFVQSLEKMAGPLGRFGICYDFCHEKQELTYMIAVEKGESREKEELEELEILEVPPSTWAIFKSVGAMPHAIQKVWGRIYSEWFPATGYEHSGGPELEVYLPGNPDSNDYVCEVWIPVKEK